MIRARNNKNANAIALRMLPSTYCGLGIGFFNDIIGATSYVIRKNENELNMTRVLSNSYTVYLLNVQKCLQLRVT